MSDPRLSLATELFRAEAERVLGHLDRHRPVIRVADAAGPAARLAAMSTYSMTARLFPHAELVGCGEVPPNPWAVLRLEDLPGRLASAVPAPTRMPEVDITVGIAVTSGADIYLGGGDWTSTIGRSPVACGTGAFPIGWQGAAVLGAAEIAKTVWSGLGLVVHPVSAEFVWNYLDHRCHPAPDTDAGLLRPIRIAVLGGGSAGSSVVGVLVMVHTVSGDAVVVDDDLFDPTRNPYRYPASTGDTSGLKAEWLARLLREAGWTSDHQPTTVGEWVPTLASAGFDGLAVSSVDDVDGRFEVADLLARTTLSLGIKGLALHLQREHLGDAWACPFCEFVNVRPAISDSQADQEFIGIPMARIEVLRLTRGKLTTEDVQHAVAAGKIRAEAAQQLVGRRLEDLMRQVYADALVPAGAAQPPTPVSAPHVSWAAGVLATAELSKAAMGLPLVDRRIDLDLSGVPLGRVLRRPRDSSGRCACASPIRRRWMRNLYATVDPA